MNLSLQHFKYLCELLYYLNFENQVHFKILFTENAFNTNLKAQNGLSKDKKGCFLVRFE